MLVDCFLSLWFRGLINLGEYSKGKATRNRALTVYKSGALRSVNNLHMAFRSGLRASDNRTPAAAGTGGQPNGQDPL